MVVQRRVISRPSNYEDLFYAKPTAKRLICNRICGASGVLVKSPPLIRKFVIQSRTKGTVVGVRRSRRVVSGNVESQMGHRVSEGVKAMGLRHSGHVNSEVILT